ncbi:MAG: hypothetical protein IRZ14_01820 [Chloroflexi bacterium]|nr:hypothetical protein [Chloroflexota bacterium]
MSQQALASIIERASMDEAYRLELQRAPDAALQGYDLTADERTALLNRDVARLESLGVDPRITKQAIYIDPPGMGPFAPGQPG